MWNQKLGALSPAQRSKILLLRNDGVTIEAIAKRYGVSPATVSRIDGRQVRNVKTQIENDPDDGPSLQEEIAAVAVAAEDTGRERAASEEPRELDEPGLAERRERESRRPAKEKTADRRAARVSGRS